MTRQRASSLPMSHSFRLWVKQGILLCGMLGALAFLRVHSQFRLQSPISSSSTDDGSWFEGTPKIAFLFLLRKDLPLDFLWHAFFKKAGKRHFSIYIHSEPGFVFNESTTRSAFFYGRQLKNSLQVVWGESSMIEAERLLLEAALHDPANQRFVLLSDSCVPLYSFSYIYGYLMSSPKSFVDSFLNVKEERYDPKMSPVIPKEKWRKGSQWIALVRRHAKIVVDDTIMFPVFRKFCKRWPPWDFSVGMQIFDLQFHRNCIPDEHYVQTLLAVSGLEDELHRRSVTYTRWNQSSAETGTWHPITFDYADAGPEKIKNIKDINHVNYESDKPTEWCHANNTLSPCFLFARKFTGGAAVRLLTEGLIDP